MKHPKKYLPSPSKAPKKSKKPCLSQTKGKSTQKVPQRHQKRTEAALNRARDRIPKPFRTKEFYNLQTEWYDKLKASGFEDIEVRKWSYADSEDITKGYGQNYQLKSRFNPDVLRHYQRVSCYLAFNQRKDPEEQLVLELYAEGISYRKIIKKLKKRFKRRKAKAHLNLFTLHHLLKRLKAEVLAWNRSSIHGLDFQPDVDPEWPVDLSEDRQDV